MLGEEDVDAASISENGSVRELVLGRGASSEPGANSDGTFFVTVIRIMMR